MNVQTMIETSSHPIYIISGEGIQGTRHEYTGKRTVSAILNALEDERNNNDRWAKAKMYSHDAGIGDDIYPVYLDIEASLKEDADVFTL